MIAQPELKSSPTIYFTSLVVLSLFMVEEYGLGSLFSVHECVAWYKHLLEASMTSDLLEAM